MCKMNLLTTKLAMPCNSVKALLWPVCDWPISRYEVDMDVEGLWLHSHSARGVATLKQRETSGVSTHFSYRHIEGIINRRQDNCGELCAYLSRTVLISLPSALGEKQAATPIALDLVCISCAWRQMSLGQVGGLRGIFCTVINLDLFSVWVSYS